MLPPLRGTVRTASGQRPERPRVRGATPSPNPTLTPTPNPNPNPAANEVGPVGLRACDRVFTCILYLNDAWEPPHEGCLRVFTRSSHPELDSGVTIERRA